MTIGERIFELREQGHFCDFKIYGADQLVLPVHKIVLAAKSKIFKEQLLQNQRENFVRIDGVKSSTLKRFVNYLYLDLDDAACEYDNSNEFIELCADYGVDVKSLPQRSQSSKMKKINIRYDKLCDKTKLSKAYQCKTCNRVFVRKKFWLKHKKSHRNSENNSFFYNNQTSVEKLFSCELCKHVFTSKGNLKRHLTVVHQGVKSYSCSYCHKLFGQKVSLQWHCLSVHKSDEEFRLDKYSSSNNNDKSDLTNHLNVNLKYDDDDNDDDDNKNSFNNSIEVKPANKMCKNFEIKPLKIVKFFEDGINDSSDGEKSCTPIRQHVVDTISKRKCHICNKLLSNPTNLHAHLQLHRSIKIPRTPKRLKNMDKNDDSKNAFQNIPSNRLLMCHQCGKQFSILRYLTRHVQTAHTQTSHKQYKCLLCVKSFVTKSELQKHQIVHTKFKCGKCEGVFTGKRAYSFHFKSTSCGSSLFLENGELDIINCGEYNDIGSYNLSSNFS